MLRTLLPAASLLCVLALVPGCVSETVYEDHGDNELVETEIARRIGEIEYMKGVELIDNLNRLAMMRDQAYPQLRAELADSPNAHTRASIIYVFEMIGDRRNIKFIRPRLEDESPRVRYQAASTLVEMGDSEGLPTLVQGLSDEDIRFRFKCFESLRNATGRDFGYRHDADPSTRDAAVARWSDWLDEVKASAL